MRPEKKLHYEFWEKPKKQKELMRQQAKGVEVKHLHTSGHATAEQLAQLIKVADP